MATTTDTTLRDLFVTGLRDAHAVEHQALALMNRQIDHLANYPEVEEQLRLHREETNGQIERLEEILASLSESHSALKDAALTMSGNMAAIAHTFAADEVIKNHFANYAFENFEIASYTGLIVLAEDGFPGAVSNLKLTLSEEQRMAQWVLDSEPAVIRKYVALRSAGATASH